MQIKDYKTPMVEVREFLSEGILCSSNPLNDWENGEHVKDEI